MHLNIRKYSLPARELDWTLQNRTIFGYLLGSLNILLVGVHIRRYRYIRNEVGNISVKEILDFLHQS